MSCNDVRLTISGKLAKLLMKGNMENEENETQPENGRVERQKERLRSEDSD